MSQFPEKNDLKNLNVLNNNHPSIMADSKPTPQITFTRWADLENHLRTNGLGSINAAPGIFHNKLGNTIFKSVPGTSYYRDEFNVTQHIIYTLFGQVGDQDLNDRYNRPLIGKNTAYLYEVINVSSTKKNYIWYGQVHYDYSELESIQHVDKNNQIRTIYRLKLTL